MAKPAEPTSLGRFFDYPQYAVGNVLPYWLAASTSASTPRVRMTGACKRAVLATIEAAIERAVVPANCGTYPASGADLTDVTIDDLSGQPASAATINSLIDIGAWAVAEYRAGFGARFVRGCPKQDWDNLVAVVAALWAGSAVNIPCGRVYAWQTDFLSNDSGGFVDAAYLMSAGVSDLAFFVADGSYASGGAIRLRLWGDFPGGQGGYQVSEWLANALDSLGANVQTPSMTPGGFADDNLDGTPSPLAVGHVGNWFGSSSSTMVGQYPSIRRSSSAWAVLQAMLANMFITHLEFPYSFVMNTVVVTRTIRRSVTMDENGDIVVEEVEDGVTTAAGSPSGNVHIWAWSNRQTGLPTIQCVFKCFDEGVGALAVEVRPQDGWAQVGSNLIPFLTFGSVTPGEAVIEFAYEETTSIASVSAANGIAYPAPGLAEYVGGYGPVTFCDAESLTTTQMEPDWKRYSVRAESGGANLASIVSGHVSWLLPHLPAYPFPSVASCPSTLAADTSVFWAGWQVYYPTSPNVTVNGNPAYFPTAFRNVAFGSSSEIPIYHDSSERAWVSNAQYEAIFGNSQHAFPDWDSISYPSRQFNIDNNGSAMAAYSWQFKAMPKA